MVLGFVLLFYSALSFGDWNARDLEPQSVSQFCKSAKKKNFFRRRLALRESRMAFANHGGLFNGGVCWWHSRFQRKATYLTVMRPDLPKPSESIARKIIAAIKKSKSLVSIPGYASFSDFSRAYDREISNTLAAWQSGEGFFQFAWISGLSGSSRPGAAKMESLLEKIRSQVEDQKRISFVHLQMPGIVNHAWLVSSIAKTSNGWNLRVVDSNFPDQTREIHYQKNEKAIYDETYGVWLAPYLAEQDEIQNLEKVIAKECQSRKKSKQSDVF